MDRVKFKENFIFRKYFYPLVLAILCFIVFASHTMYVLRTHQFPAAGLDEHAYMEMAVNYYDIVRNPSPQMFSEILDVNQYRQPFYSIVLSVIFIFTGIEKAYKIALFTNVFFYILTIISIYFLGKQFLTKKASFLASFMFAFYGFPLFYLHFTYSETATTTFVVLSLLFLARSHYFLKSKEVILFSVFFALGNLTRWVVPIFVGGSLLLIMCVALFHILTKKNRDIRNFITNVIIFLFVAVIPSLVFYYLPNIDSFRSYISGNSYYGQEWAVKFLGSPDFSNVFSTRSIMYYFNILSQQTIFFWLLFFVGFLLSVISFKKFSFILLAFIVPYLCFTFGGAFKGDRFIVPIYPAMALISAVVIDSVHRKLLLQNLLVALIIIIGFLNFLGSSWGFGPMGQQGLMDIVLPAFIHHPRRIYLTPMVWPPRPEEGNVYEIVNAIKQDWHKKEPFIFLSLFDMSQISDGFHTILAYQERNIGGGVNIWAEPIDRYDEVFEKLRSANYVLVKNGVIGRYLEGTDKNYDAFINFIIKFNKVLAKANGEFPAAYTLIKKVFIPFDKSALTIYRKDREMTPAEWIKFGSIFVEVDPSHELLIKEAINKIINR